MSESTSSVEQRAAALRALLPPGTALHAGASDDPTATVLDIAPRDQHVVVAFRWMAYPHRLAYAIGPGSEYSDDSEVEEPDRWADDALTWLQEQLGTGLVMHGAAAKTATSSNSPNPDGRPTIGSTPTRSCPRETPTATPGTPSTCSKTMASTPPRFRPFEPPAP